MTIKTTVQKTHYDPTAEASARLVDICTSVRQMAARVGIVNPDEAVGMPELLTKIEKTLAAYRLMPIDFSVHKFTPKDALDLLGGEDREKNKDNRSLGDRIVTRYGNDMTAGRWRTTHQAIAVGPDGRMVDGQHRLEAIIRTGVPVEMILAIYRDEKMAELARQCVDTGRARLCGDSLEISGMVNRGLGKRTASILSALAAISEPAKWGGHTTADLRARYELEKPSVDFAASLSRTFAAPVAASFAYAFPVAATQIREFARIVTDKVGIQAGSGAFHFVRLFDGISRKEKFERAENTRRALRCMQMHILDERQAKFIVSEKGLDYFRAKRTTLGLPT